MRYACDMHTICEGEGRKQGVEVERETEDQSNSGWVQATLELCRDMRRLEN